MEEMKEVIIRALKVLIAINYCIWSSYLMQEITIGMHWAPSASISSVWFITNVISLLWILKDVCGAELLMSKELKKILDEEV